MHGICFDYELQDWFDFKIPQTKIAPDYIADCFVPRNDGFSIKPSAKIIWFGGKPIVESFAKSKKGNSWEMMKLTFHDKTETFEISLEKEKAEWLIAVLELTSVYNLSIQTFGQLKESFESQFEDFELFWYSKPIATLRQFGLLVL